MQITNQKIRQSFSWIDEEIFVKKKQSFKMNLRVNVKGYLR